MSDAAASAAASDTVLTDGATASADASTATNTDTTTTATDASTLLTTDATATTTDATKTEPTEAEKAEAERVAAEKAAKTGAPEAYTDFTLPENFKANEQFLGEFKNVAKELNLSQEQAQKLVDLQTKEGAASAQRFSTELQSHVDRTAKEWETTAKADPEFGGEKFSENVAIAKQALDAFGTPELKTLLKESRLGSHPEVIRMLFKAGKAISQDGFVPGRASSAAKDTATALYGSTK